MPTKSILIALCLLLAGCDSFPRGAGVQSKILSEGEATDAQGLPSEFAVEPITRASLSRYADWPAVGERGLPWIDRVNLPDSRIIAPGDMISLTIWNTEDNGLLTVPGQRFVTLPPSQVSTAGEIFLPYIGRIKVSGGSPERARADIEKSYTAVTPSAQVQLTMAEGRQSTASVVGGVAKPGAYPLGDQDVTLLDLVAQAGGVAPSLTNPQIRLQRGDKTYGIAVSRILEDTAKNTTLKGGDRVFVEEDKRYFLSLGAAGTEAQHRFPQQKVTALDAMSIIGGLTPERADAKGILILRQYSAKSVRSDGSGPRNVRTIFTIDLTSADGLFSAGQFQVRAGDLIYVSESPLLGTRNLFSLIGSLFGFANQASAIAN